MSRLGFRKSLLVLGIIALAAVLLVWILEPSTNDPGPSRTPLPGEPQTHSDATRSGSPSSLQTPDEIFEFPFGTSIDEIKRSVTIAPDTGSQIEEYIRYVVRGSKFGTGRSRSVIAWFDAGRLAAWIVRTDTSRRSDLLRLVKARFGNPTIIDDGDSKMLTWPEKFRITSLHSERGNNDVELSSFDSKYLAVQLGYRPSISQPGESDQPSAMIEDKIAEFIHALDSTMKGAGSDVSITGRSLGGQNVAITMTVHGLGEDFNNSQIRSLLTQVLSTMATVFEAGEHRVKICNDARAIAEGWYDENGQMHLALL